MTKTIPFHQPTGLLCGECPHVIYGNADQPVACRAQHSELQLDDQNRPIRLQQCMDEDE